MNRDQIWQQLKDEKETIYGKKMLDVFLSVVDVLNPNHLEEALDSGYEVSDNAIRNNIGDVLNSRRKEILLDKIIANKKDMSSRLMRHILNAMNNTEIKEMAPKMNINKMELEDVYSLVWLKIESIELMQELFGEKLKQFSVKQIFSLIKESITPARGAPKGIEILDKLVNVLGGWKSLVEKMMHEQDSLARNGQLNPSHYENLKINLNDTGLNKYFAEKIIEHGKDMNFTFIDAESLAQAFYRNVGKA